MTNDQLRQETAKKIHKAFNYWDNEGKIENILAKHDRELIEAVLEEIEEGTVFDTEGNGIAVHQFKDQIRVKYLGEK